MTTWLLLHGTPLTTAVWEPAGRLLDGPVVVPDLSHVPVALDAQARLAEAAVATVTDDAVDVVGHSFGGQIAIEAALLLGPRLRSLTILCSRDTPFPAFTAVATAVRGGDPPPLDATLARWFTPADLAADGDLVQQVRADLAGVSLPDWANALDAIAVYDRSAALAAITAPATLVAAGLDHVSPPEAMAAFAGRLPEGRLVVHDEWAHMSPFLDPATLASLLAEAAGR